MKDRQLPQAVIDKFADHKERIFSSPEDWERHLQALGITELNVAPDPVLIASEGALWGTIRHQGLLEDTVIVSDDAGQFRVGVHALCWVHAERLVHKLVPANDKQRNAVEVAKRMIWWFYASLKEYKQGPSPEQAEILRARFDRIFKRRRTGYVMLDRLLKRLFRRKDALLRVLDRPEIPSTPTLPKTTFAPSSRNGKSLAEPSATAAATPATSCWGWPTKGRHGAHSPYVIEIPRSVAADRVLL